MMLNSLVARRRIRGEHAQDDEVERMERQGHRIIETMYGRANPKPREPSFSPEELVLMERSEQAALVKIAEQKANPQKTQWDYITYDGMVRC